MKPVIFCRKAADFPLAAQLDEMRALLRAFGKEHAIIGDDAHRNAIDMGKAGDKRRAVARLELIEIGAVDDRAITSRTS